MSIWILALDSRFSGEPSSLRGFTARMAAILAGGAIQLSTLSAYWPAWSHCVILIPWILRFFEHHLNLRWFQPNLPPDDTESVALGKKVRRSFGGRQVSPLSLSFCGVFGVAKSQCATEYDKRSH